MEEKIKTLTWLWLMSIITSLFFILYLKDENIRLKEQIEVLETLIPMDTTFDIDTREIKPIVKVVDNFNYKTDKFTYAFKAFKAYNPYIDSQTVKTFVRVANFYHLDTSKRIFSWSVGQILLESGAKQRHSPSHPNAHEVLVSPSGAVGICQIIPSTAMHYIQNVITKKEMDKMVKLGADRIALKRDSSYAYKREITEKWLSNKTNNMILWGYIMNQGVKREHSMRGALVSYAVGIGGKDRYLENGGSLNDHHYTKGIMSKLSHINDL